MKKKERCGVVAVWAIINARWKAKNQSFGPVQAMAARDAKKQLALAITRKARGECECLGCKRRG